ncbi:23S rRNA pseudouridine(1911/1915/1917) synthase RluD [Celerinatantimonas sp. MCCC 1A17872]|uniref:23S rRNA pseudouridine(1911/1915/1917) synthase RluD n=1 Tax=Celerinatantimonas sp. MCCC 1A17872 TaxID=3177514 RepID=UPI0038C9DBEF
MSQQIELQAKVAEDHTGMRLDQVLSELFSDYSRSRLKEWIIQGQVYIDGRVADKPREKLQGFETLTLKAVIEDVIDWQPEPVDLNIVYEDDDILVINKAAGQVVHPGAGNHSGTILNGLLYHYPQSRTLARAGIVHRLDKDTTGLMVVAKSVAAQTHLVDALQKREITREYEAIAIGSMTAGGLVDEPIGRHKTKRTQMAVDPFGRPAVTHYRVAEKFRQHTRLRLRLETGRTHQIRVHMAHIGHPLVGDPVYAGRLRLPRGASDELVQVLRDFQRQALHAAMLRLAHPISGEMMQWQADVPSDMVKVADALRRDSEAHDWQI